jgi:hypothetical protein
MSFASTYLNDGRPVIAPNQTFFVGKGHRDVVGTVKASDPDPDDTLRDWQIKGGSGAYKFSIDGESGEITVADEREIDFTHPATYDLVVMVGDGKLPSHDQVVRIIVSRKHSDRR